MTAITHHISDTLLLSYASGELAHPFAVVVASHISLCPECRARLGAHEAAGGVVLEALAPQSVTAGLKDTLLSRLDTPMPEPEQPRYRKSGIFPGAVMTALKGQPPRWKMLGRGVRQSILHDGRDGSVRLLYIPAGQAVPDHGHRGLELTLVLQGSFSDETGTYGVGDVEIANQELDHTPIAGMGKACICIAATDAPLRFFGTLPRLLQPLFKI